MREKQTCEDRPAGPRGLLGWVLGAALVCTLLASLGAWGYVRYGAGILQAVDKTVSDMALREARQLAESGQSEAAIARYRAALQMDFESEQDRVYAMKALGTLLWQAGEIEAAAAYLREVAASPWAPRSVYVPLSECLFSLKAYEEGETVARRWLVAAGEADAREEQAEAWYQLGRLALEQGDAAAAEDAFKQGLTLQPGGRNASDLASLCYQQGREAEALAYLDAYLEHGAKGGRAAYARELRARLREAQNGEEAGAGSTPLESDETIKGPEKAS